VKELRFFAALRTLRGFFADPQNDSAGYLRLTKGTKVGDNQVSSG